MIAEERPVSMQGSVAMLISAGIGRWPCGINLACDLSVCGVGGKISK